MITTRGQISSILTTTWKRWKTPGLWESMLEWIRKVVARKPLKRLRRLLQTRRLPLRPSPRHFDDSSGSEFAWACWCVAVESICLTVISYYYFTALSGSTNYSLTIQLAKRHTSAKSSSSKHHENGSTGRNDPPEKRKGGTSIRCDKVQQTRISRRDWPSGYHGWASHGKLC